MKLKRKTIPKYCLNCGELFDARLDSAGKYCSRKCAARYRNQLDADKFQDGLAWKKINCEYCGEECYQKLWQFNKIGYGFCSKSCSMRHKLKTGIIDNSNKNGENNPNWKGGTSRYIQSRSKSDERNEKELLHRVLIEDLTGRKLEKNEHVHHIDGDHKNNNIENLIVVSSKEHKELHFSLELIARKLIKKGLIIFDKNRREYQCLIE